MSEYTIKDLNTGIEVTAPTQEEALDLFNKVPRTYYNNPSRTWPYYPLPTSNPTYPSYPSVWCSANSGTAVG